MRAMSQKMKDTDGHEHGKKAPVVLTAPLQVKINERTNKSKNTNICTMVFISTHD